MGQLGQYVVQSFIIAFKMGQLAHYVPVWYIDGDRLGGAERAAARALLDARRDVHSRSLDTLRAKVAEDPEDLAARRRLVVGEDEG